MALGWTVLLQCGSCMKYAWYEPTWESDGERGREEGRSTPVRSQGALEGKLSQWITQELAVLCSLRGSWETISTATGLPFSFLISHLSRALLITSLLPQTANNSVCVWKHSSAVEQVCACVYTSVCTCNGVCETQLTMLCLRAWVHVCKCPQISDSSADAN